MNKVIEQVIQLLPSLHGWASPEKGICLASYAVAIKAKVCCEIGTWGGKAAIPMMLAMRELWSGTVICIDPWRAEESAKGQHTEADKKWWTEEANHELVYQHFIYHVEKLNLGQYCEIRRMTSDQSDVPAVIDLLHIDGNHDVQALTDTTRFAPAVRLYGICVLDDLDWTGGYVRQAEQWLLANGFIMLHLLGTGAVYMRTQ